MQDNITYIRRIRAFNRFYTVLLGIVDRNYMHSHSLAEARILYELEGHPGCSAVNIAQTLQLNKGYLSRILKKFEADGLLERRPSQTDGRAYLLYLTEAGQAEAQVIDRISDQQVAKLIQYCDPETCTRICQAMDLIEQNFTMQEETP